jgi:putative NIF3 family GTP cyclohydrolase 1 type 2
MKAIDIREHFVSQADWIDQENTVDRIIVGDPDKDVGTVLVTWISSFAAVREAVRRGVDMLVTHEPTFYVHAKEMENREPTEIVEAKHRFIEESGLVILRIHDCWDRWPKIGIPWAWGRFLELGDQPASISENRFLHRHDIEPTTLEELAQRVAARTASIGEPYVQVTGDGAQTVSRVGVGTGCGCWIPGYQELGCDVSIVCDDGSCYWSNIQRAEDEGHPVIRVNHGTSEEPGMVTLAKYIDEQLAGVTAEHLAHGSTFRLVGA